MNRQFLTAFVDVLMLLLVCVFAMLVMAQWDDPKKDEAEKPQVIGQLQVFMSWPDSAVSDVDLWVQAPGDKAVGYPGKAGKVFDLLRDDLGYVNDVTGMNFENAFTRGLPPGEYLVNVHLYRADLRDLPIKVKVICQLRKNPESDLVTVFVQEVTLTNSKQEITVMRFTLDGEGNVVSTSRLPKPIVTARGGQ